MVLCMANSKAETSTCYSVGIREGNIKEKKKVKKKKNGHFTLVQEETSLLCPDTLLE